VNATHFASFSAYFTVNHISTWLNIPPCDLLMLRNVTSAHKGLAPSGKKKHPLFSSIKIICIFEIFIELATGVLCSCRAHTTGHKTCRFQWVIKRFVPHQVLYRGIMTLHAIRHVSYPRPLPAMLGDTANLKHSARNEQTKTKFVTQTDRH